MPHELSPQAHIGSIYRDHHGWLSGWLRKQLGSAAEAADLAHDTFERLLSRRETGGWADPRAFLTTVARGLVIDLYRRRDVERAYLEALASVPEAHCPGPEQRAMLLESLCAIDAMLDGLRPAVREAFLMSQLDGLTYREIAAQLGVTERTVANYMGTAMSRCLDLAA